MYLWIPCVILAESWKEEIKNLSMLNQDVVDTLSKTGISSESKNV